MSTHQLTEKVCRIVAGELFLDDAKVLRTSRLWADLRADLHSMADIVLALEKEFGIDIPGSDVTQIQTVGELCDYLDKRGVN